MKKSYSENDFDCIPSHYANTGFYILQEIGKFPLLNNEETIELLKKKSDPEAREKLINANLRLVVDIVEKYIPLDNQNFSDYFQEGTIGLSIAIDKYDYKKGCKLSTYAYWWIKQAILRYSANNSRTIRIAAHSHEIVLKLQKASDLFFMEHGYTPSHEELSDILGISKDEITLLFNINNVLSLNAPVSDEPNSNSETTLFIADDSLDLDEIIDSKFVKENLFESIKLIFKNEPRNIEILEKRFGLNDNDVQTLEEIAEYYGITRERIRQLENKALRNLKNNREFKKRFYNYVE